jgi:apoptosis-inducing factor 3
VAEDDGAKKRNLAEGLLVRDLADGAIAVGKAAGEDVLLVRRGDEFFAVGANCTH